MLTRSLVLGSLLFCGAIFGFFYAWVCSTMWGLDSADPRVAIAAMQAMNASVRNAVFAPAFFGTPVVLVLTSLACLREGDRARAGFATVAAAVYVVGCIVPTVVFNVPLNEGLAAASIPEAMDAARELWGEYSMQWQFWNRLRAIAAGIALLTVGYGLLVRAR